MQAGILSFFPKKLFADPIMNQDFEHLATIRTLALFLFKKTLHGFERQNIRIYFFFKQINIRDISQRFNPNTFN